MMAQVWRRAPAHLRGSCPHPACDWASPRTWLPSLSVPVVAVPAAVAVAAPAAAVVEVVQSSPYPPPPYPVSPWATCAHSMCVVMAASISSPHSPYIPHPPCVCSSRGMAPRMWLYHSSTVGLPKATPSATPQSLSPPPCAPWAQWEAMVARADEGRSSGGAGVMARVETSWQGSLKNEPTCSETDGYGG